MKKKNVRCGETVESIFRVVPGISVCGQKVVKVSTRPHMARGEVQRTLLTLTHNKGQVSHYEILYWGGISIVGGMLLLWLELNTA